MCVHVCVGMYIYVWAHACHCVCVEVSRQLVGVSLLWVLGTELRSSRLGGRPVPRKSSCQSVYSRECEGMLWWGVLAGVTQLNPFYSCAKLGDPQR